MPVLGDIARKARERMPATWKALAGRDEFGEEGLQSRTDDVKYRLFGEVVAHDQEMVRYGPLGTDYAGVVLALELIVPGYDHWNASATSWSASGKNENKTFLNRADGLLKLRDEILKPEEARLYPLVADLLVDVLEPRRRMVPRAADPLDAHHVTPDPFSFEGPFERPLVVIPA